MCSIAGYNGPSRPEQDGMLAELMRHRGPDAEGRAEAGPWVLLHQRLSIVDLSAAANQPMRHQDDWLVFNGEIYNHPELRAAHLADVPLRSSSDTEVLLELLVRHGLPILHQLNGMFAFAWYQAATDTLHLVRDRFGVKPLYWTRQGQQFAFASEIKPLLRWRGALDWHEEYVGQYLQTLRSDDGEPTLDRQIRQVPAGHRLSIRAGTASLQRWYQFADSSPAPAAGSIAEVAEQFEELLVDAIRLRLRADVPVALTLSGGLDSTTIYALAKNRLGVSVQPFTLVRPGFLDSETTLARQLARQFGDQLQEVTIPPALDWETARAGLWWLEFPGISLAAGAYLQVYRAIQQAGYRVVLEGHGGDELLGGYPLHVQAAWRTELARGNYRSALRLYRQHQALSPADLRPHRHRSPWWWRFWREARRQRVGSEHFEAVLRESFERSSLPLILREFDRLPMACSLESRSPFMDYRVVEFARSLPLEHKINHLGTKALLRQILRRHGAEAVAAVRCKVPFTTDLLGFVAGNGPALRDTLAGLEGQLAPIGQTALKLLDQQPLRWHGAQYICRAAAVRLTQQSYAAWLGNVPRDQSALSVQPG